jgi:hypothetical protein
VYSGEIQKITPKWSCLANSQRQSVFFGALAGPSAFGSVLFQLLAQVKGQEEQRRGELFVWSTMGSLLRWIHSKTNNTWKVCTSEAMPFWEVWKQKNKSSSDSVCETTAAPVAGGS